MNSLITLAGFAEGRVNSRAWVDYKELEIAKLLATLSQRNGDMSVPDEVGEGYVYRDDALTAIARAATNTKPTPVLPCACHWKLKTELTWNWAMASATESAALVSLGSYVGRDRNDPVYHPNDIDVNWVPGYLSARETPK